MRGIRVINPSLQPGPLETVAQPDKPKHLLLAIRSERRQPESVPMSNMRVGLKLIGAKTFIK